MYRAGRFAVWLGIFLTAVGVIGGFGAMFADYDDLAMILLTAVPFGFVILFAGVVSTLLSSPE